MRSKICSRNNHTLVMGKLYRALLTTLMHVEVNQLEPAHESYYGCLAL